MHVLDLKRNLISLVMFDQIMHNNRLKLGVLSVMNGSIVVMKGLRKNGVYVLVGEVVVGESRVSLDNNIDKTKLWHLRLRDVSENCVKELQK